MDKIFLDTNICIDLVTKRSPYFKSVLPVIQLVADGKIAVYTSSGSIYTTYYVASSVYKINNAAERIHALLDFVEILDTPKPLIREALLSAFKDKEDALQYYTAITTCDFILTRNVKHFKTGKAIPAYSPEILLKSY